MVKVRKLSREPGPVQSLIVSLTRKVPAPPPEGECTVAGPASVDEYLFQIPEEARAALEDLRKTIKTAAPDATETISYQMPTFKYRGRALVGFAAFKNHCSLFPYSGKVLDDYQEELGSFKTSKGTIQFTTDRPLPKPLVKKIVKTRIAEIEE
jgi:uncharacterized protein YdhG (YjbR/CyaY superfamily)